MSARLVFLKLGGSLITVKDQPHTPRLDVLERLAQEIAQAHAADPQLSILLGHGSGSFGHVPASKYHTRKGVKTPEQWQGFVEVWRQASALTHLVMQALEHAALPALVFPPMAAVTARDGRVVAWNLEPLQSAQTQGLIPVIHGDVVFDRARGGTILSTEDLFSYLTPRLRPAHLLLAGIEPGVWRDFPANTQILAEITPNTFPGIEAGLKGSASPDVTGGMLDKVHQLLLLVNELPGLTASIFSGEQAGSLYRSLLGEQLGTLIHSEQVVNLSKGEGL
jgi:isopentenyl phosphate kinase